MTKRHLNKGQQVYLDARTNSNMQQLQINGNAQL